MVEVAFEDEIWAKTSHIHTDFTDFAVWYLTHINPLARSEEMVNYIKANGLLGKHFNPDKLNTRSFSGVLSNNRHLLTSKRVKGKYFYWCLK